MMGERQPFKSPVLIGLRPALPKYTVTYDPNLILNYMDTLPKNKHLVLELLVKKLATLLCLLNGQRGQTIGMRRVDYCHYADGQNTIKHISRGSFIKPSFKLNYFH